MIKIVISYNGEIEPLRNIFEWLDENAGEEYFEVNNIGKSLDIVERLFLDSDKDYFISFPDIDNFLVFHFKDKDKALIFKLTYGGYNETI